jgi:hypothetical protein
MTDRCTGCRSRNLPLGLRDGLCPRCWVRREQYAGRLPLRWGPRGWVWR